jgi:hypothetical protein
MQRIWKADFRSAARWAVALAAAAVLSGCGGGGNSASNQTAAAVTPVHFVNSQADAKSPNLSAHYVDFSFDYPSNWTLDPATGTPTAKNFVKVERDNPDGLTIENFAVGEFAGTGDPDQDSALIPQLLAQLEAQVTGMPGYLYGRMIILPEPDTAKGVVLIMLGTDLSGEIHSPADLGVKGDLPKVLSSFKFGAAGGPGGADNAAADDSNGASQ